jgi:hypothetical protein
LFNVTGRVYNLEARLEAKELEKNKKIEEYHALWQ